ncbi:interferon-induced GTP-binding protein Mx3-like [Scleropages formosus]|uniref:Myxovirus (influenza virus) resistance G n=1 Tax=Scleropages formosus TaxID=113540 RepID=A0A8C9RGT7_SCLFO|nr:interferon-induced GTP-binding protein Mx3-like [Scleropages formosus]
MNFFTEMEHQDMISCEELESSLDSLEEPSKVLLNEECNKHMEGEFHTHLDERVRPYIDLIDSMRLTGIEKDLALPSIAVIGDQSSGKSSVLEALSGVALPRGSGIVTRCPLELKLRKLKGGVQWRAVISYREESAEFFDPMQVEQYVKKAQNELAGEGVGICEELISLEISSPDVCDLSLIDLPGIARVPVRGQPDNIADQIRSLILKVISKGETINLVIVPCNVDIATTEALKMAQEVDPEGKRTLAILTKPDLVDKGTEKSVLDIVHNKVIPLSKGYLIVKCRGQQQINDRISLTEASRIERDFFRRHEYFSSLLYEDKATIQCLANKLTQDLVDHIRKSLPLLSEQIKKQLWDTKKELGTYDVGPPLDLQNRRTYLIEILSHFNEKINRLCLGEVVNQENLFVLLRTEFKKWKDHLDNSKDTFYKTVNEVVSEYDLKHRGRELLGFSDYNVFEMVVQRLVVQLKSSAIETLQIIRGMVQSQFSDIANVCFNGYPFLLCVSSNKIDNIESKQQAKVEERIMEQFEMEQLVYTQDGIYFKTLNETTGFSGASEDNFAGYDCRSKYPQMLQAYYEIVVQRLADQVPMLIRFFMLKQSAKVLCTEMLKLIDGGNVNEILREETESSRRRAEMQNRIERLSAAQDKLNNFI